MIGRGLLTNPALALEYKENRTLTPDEMKEKLHIMHTSVYNQYAAQLEGGDGQLLNKMKTFLGISRTECGQKTNESNP